MDESLDVPRRPWRLGPRALRWFDFLFASALVLPNVPLTLLFGHDETQCGDASAEAGSDDGDVVVVVVHLTRR